MLVNGHLAASSPVPHPAGCPGPLWETPENGGLQSCWDLLAFFFNKGLQRLFVSQSEQLKKNANNAH